MEENGQSRTIPLKMSANGVIPHASRSHTSGINQEDDLNLHQVWLIIRHRWLLIATIAVGIATTTALWTFYKTPIYQGSFQLLVGEPITDKDSNNQDVLEALKSNDVDYATQIEVLGSSSILEPVITQLKEKYPQLKYEDLVEGKKAPLQISQLQETKILEVTLKDQDPQKIKFILETLSQVYLRYSLEERKTEINQGVDFVATQLPQLRQRVYSRQAQLQKFRQTYNFLDPEQKAQNLSEQLSKLQEKQFDAQVQLNETTALYEALEKQIKLAPDQAISSSFLSESPRYQNLLNQLQEVEIELAKESTRFVEDSPVIVNLKEKRANLLPLLQAEAQQTLGKKESQDISKSSELTSPSTLRLALNQQLVETANQLQVLQVRSLGLNQEIQTIKQQIQQMPTLARQYTDLQRELKVATESLNRFLEAEEKLQIDAAQKTFPWQLISQPKVEKKPIYPQPIRNIALGAIAGILLGVGAAFLIDRFDPVFHSLEELKEKTELPLLGVIPWQKDLTSKQHVLRVTLPQLRIGNHRTNSESFGETSESVKSGYKSSGFLEAFRSLNTNIWLLGSEQPLHSLVISSASPKDGKSTVTMHLAQAAAAMGRRVLLIDADLRCPQIHRVLGMENAQGLSNILASGLEPEIVIQSVPHWDNLSVITAGDIPPDPTRLLASRRMKDFQEYLQRKNVYDLVIYDTPPLINFADARILGANLTGVILVVRVNQTDRSGLKYIIDDLTMSQVSLLGLVANGADRRGYGMSNYYYYNRPS